MDLMIKWLEKVVFARNIKSANIHNRSRKVTTIKDRLDKR